MRFRAADMEQEVFVRCVADRLVEELYGAAAALELFEQNHPVDVVAGEPVGRRDEDAVEGGPVKRGKVGL